FGDRADIQVPAGFHVSTADYLALADGGRFDARLPAADTVLSAANPVAFGFLDAPVGNLSLAPLARVAAPALSLVGGDIETSILGELDSRGELRLASAAGAGEIPLDMAATVANPVVDYGTIALGTQSQLVAGTVAISAGDLQMPIGASIIADGVRAGEGANVIAIEANSILLARGSSLTSAGGDIQLAANSVEVSDRGRLNAEDGRVTITGPGDASADTVILKGLNDEDFVELLTLIDMNPGGASPDIDNTLAATEIRIASRSLIMDRAARLEASGRPGPDPSGDISLAVEEFRGSGVSSIFSFSGNLTIGGLDLEPGSSAKLVQLGDPESPFGQNGGRFDIVILSNTGDARVLIDSAELQLARRSSLESRGDSGVGGDIILRVDSLSMDDSQLLAFSGPDGVAGDIIIEGTGGTGPARHVSLVERSSIATDFERPQSVSGTAGNVLINSEQIVLDASSISAETANSGSANITLFVDELRMNTGFVNAPTRGSGDAGTISIQGTGSTAEDPRPTRLIDMQQFSSIINDSTEGATGNAGDVDIRVEELRLVDSGISSASLSDEGNGGNLLFNVDRLLIDGDNPDLGMLDEERRGIRAFTDSSANSGNIVISGVDATADNRTPATLVSLRGELQPIDASSRSNSEEAGDAGNIDIFASEILLGERSLISSGTETSAGGDILLMADLISLLDEGRISTRVSEYGQGGDIMLQARRVDIMRRSSIAADAFGADQNPQETAAGSITVEADQLNMSASRISATANQGDAGSVNLQVNGLDLQQDSQITTEAIEGGGSIFAKVVDRLDMQDSLISATARGLSVDDSGGNIAISNPQFIILERSAIQANANAGNGGNIAMATGAIIQSGDSFITATSASNADGQVDIEAVVDRTNSLIEVEVPEVVVPVPLSNRCGAEQLSSRSSFTIARTSAASVATEYLEGEQEQAAQPLAFQCQPAKVYPLSTTTLDNESASRTPG
ncbi:MAG: hypothetical protein AAGF46_07945, partial [Pseudomonadota bacterium]